MGAMDEWTAAAQSALAEVGNGVVAVGRDGRGSGMVVAEGRVLTNAHNLRGRTTTVSFADGREAAAEVLGTDLDGDLAVLAVDTAAAPPMRWSDTAPAAGDAVLALSAGGRRGVRVTAGMVSACDQAFRGPRGRRVAGSVEHTAPLPRGSSGGPLLDLSGAVVGVNTHRVEPGFYLARPADEELRRRVEQLAAGVSPSHRRLGVALAPAPVAARLRASVGLPPRDGLLVAAVEDESPAAAAGIARGDLLVRAGGRDLRTPDDLHEALAAASGAGDESLAVDLVRGSDEVSLTVTFTAAGGGNEP